MEIGTRAKAEGLEKGKLGKKRKEGKGGKDREARWNTFSSTSFVLTRYKGKGEGGGKKSKRSSLAFPIGLMRSFLRCGDSLGNSNGSFSTLLPPPGFRQIIAECERNKLGVSGESVNDRIGSLVCIKIFVILFLTWISIGNNSSFLFFFSSSSIFLINAMEIGRAWSMHTSVSTSHKNFSLDSLSSIAWCRTRNCVVLNFYKEPVSSRIVNYGRYFLYGKSKMRSSFIRSVCLLCRFVKIAVQRHGYLNLHEAFPFPSEYSVNTSYIHIYIPIKRDVPWIEYQLFIFWICLFYVVSAFRETLHESILRSNNTR